MLDSARKDSIDPEIQVLLEILSGKEEVNIYAEGFNAERIIKLALMHRVTYQLMQFAQQQSGLFIKQQLELLTEHTRKNASRSLMQLHELMQICKRLNEQGISYACIKGPQLARMLYGKEALKESVDLDLMLINVTDLKDVHRQLAKMGYSRSNLNDYKSRFAKKIFLLAKREVHYFNPENGCHIDLHVRAGANTYLTAGRFKGLFKDLQIYDLEGVPVPILTLEKYLVFLCYHGALHQFCRLGWLIDIRFFLRQLGEKIDFDKAVAIAGTFHIQRSYFLALSLIGEIFGDKIPKPFEKGNVNNRQIRYLLSACKHIWGKHASYSLTLKGRSIRLLYLILLSKGLTAKMDILAGIFFRNLLPVLRFLRL